MPWVRFLAAFNYRIARRKVVIAYPAGHEGLVKSDCAAQAVRLGRAVEIERPIRKANEHASDPVG
jgi:hypothetical protein